MSFFPRDLVAPAATTSPVIEWEEPDCALCGSRHHVPLVEAPDVTAGGSGLWFVVVQCQKCGLCYTSPRPNIDTIGQFYPAVYGPHQSPSARQLFKRNRWIGGKHTPYQEQLISESRIQGGRLLDFGCGGGRFIARMAQQSWKVTGIDTSTMAIQRVRSELGLRALVGTLPHPELKPASFEAITMWHSLEHVHEPLEVLQEAHRLLVPGGRIVIAVPNIDSLPFRWFGSAWYGLDLPRHLVHFAPWTLHLMLEQAGFRGCPIRMVRHSDWMRWSAKLACQRESGLRWHRWVTKKPWSRLAACYCQLSKQSDCMVVSAER
jgi:SAM-dependent methyltransferase